MLNGHGNDLHKYTNIVADFSSNVWFQGPPIMLLDYIQTQAISVANYPEPAAESFCAKAEEYFNLQNKSVLATNGSAEAFYLVARNFEKQSATVLYPSFAEYQDACLSYQMEINYVSNQNLTDKHLFNTKTVWLGNPNNPDGKIFTKEIIQSWLKNNQDTVFIIDEAYAELSISYQSVISLLAKYTNLIVIKSFTKTFAIPGLRSGIILTSPELARQLNKWLIPWAVNSIAVNTGKFIIDHYNELLFDKTLLKNHCQLFQKKINQIKNIEVVPSDCNYFLARLKKGTASNLKKYLASEHGILIRNADNFYGLSKQHIRLASQTEQKNNLLIQALNQWNSL